MRWCARWGVAALLCGCPGDPVEGQGSIGSDETSTSTDGTMTASSTMTTGSQSGTDSTSGTLTMTTDDTTDPTLEDTSAESTSGETTIAATDDTTSASAGTSESTGNAVCMEVNKPNDTEAMAVPLAAIPCETSMNVEATADDATAPDWFTFYGAYDEVACGGETYDYGEPHVQVAGLPVCAFASCTAVAVTCMVGGAQMSPGGLPGCCGDGDAHLLVDCDTPNESADVFVMIDTAGADCQPYTMTLSF
jgi:hypothetical protein